MSYSYYSTTAVKLSLQKGGVEDDFAMPFSSRVKCIKCKVYSIDKNMSGEKNSWKEGNI